MGTRRKPEVCEGDSSGCVGMERNAERGAERNGAVPEVVEGKVRKEAKQLRNNTKKK